MMRLARPFMMRSVRFIGACAVADDWLATRRRGRLRSSAHRRPNETQLHPQRARRANYTATNRQGKRRPGLMTSGQFLRRRWQTLLRGRKPIGNLCERARTAASIATHPPMKHQRRQFHRGEAEKPEPSHVAGADPNPMPAGECRPQAERNAIPDPREALSGLHECLPLNWLGLWLTCWLEPRSCEVRRQHTAHGVGSKRLFDAGSAAEHDVEHRGSARACCQEACWTELVSSPRSTVNAGDGWPTESLGRRLTGSGQERCRAHQPNEAGCERHAHDR